MKDKKNLPAKEIEAISRHVVYNIAQGLKDLHKLGIVHRDIKPLNILVEQKKKEIYFFISDFGVSFRQQS